MELTKRVRASTPRSRSGCANCRTRRIKCDEKRPACERCLRSGWTCPGYSRSSATGNHNGVSSANVQSIVASAPALSITQYSLPFKVPGSQDERRSLHYFANFAAADVSGYLPSDFWSRTILQRCQQDVPVRHAAAVLGRAHMEYVTAADSASFNVSAETAEAYTKATKAVRNYIGKNGFKDRAMVLMCSALFYCFELMRSDRRGALEHLEGGTRILQGWQIEDGDPISAVDSRNELRSAFIRMELQAGYYDDARIPNLSAEIGQSFESNPQGPSPLPAFDTLHEAQDSLFSLLHSALVCLTQNIPWKFLDPIIVPAHVHSQRKQLLHHFDQWNSRMAPLRETIDGNTASSATWDTDRHRTVLAVFKLHWQTGRLLILHSLEDDLKATGPSFDDVAEEHLQLARNVISTPVQAEERGRSQTRDRSFSLHLGIVTPILLLALKTQHAHIREVAIELLQEAKGRREGFHDAETSASLIQELEAHSKIMTVPAIQVDPSLPPPLEWLVDPIVNVKCWEDKAERIDGWEKLWITAV